MEENKIKDNIDNNLENKGSNNQNNGPKQIAGAIIIAGVIIAGAILLKGSSAPTAQNSGNNGIPVTSVSPVSATDRTEGDPKAKVTLILYEDFQCPYCGAISGLVSNSEAIKYLKGQDPTWAPFMPAINDYVKNGQVLFVYRDFPFLGDRAKQSGGEDESTKAAEAARCAGDQGKFWEYHDYLYGHQNGEQQGAFSVVHLKSFAQTLGLDTASFNQCMDTDKYATAVALSKTEAYNAGVTGTPKGFILRDGKVVATIDGAEPLSMVKPKIDNALK